MKRLVTGGIAIGILAHLFALLGCAPGNPKEKDTFFVDLMSFPAYVKNGFSADDINPSAYDKPDWTRVDPTPENRARPLLMARFDDGSTPPRPVFSPFREKDREFTISIPFSLNNENLDILFRNRGSVVPGLYFAALAYGWEIYLNDTLVMNELHLDENRQITSKRWWRQVYFPINRSNLLESNCLTVHVVGPTHSDSTGFFYTSPYYIGNYLEMTKTYDESITVALCAVYLFFGLYFMGVYLAHKERYFLYYGLFSITVGIFLFTRTHTVHFFFPDSTLPQMVEYFSLLWLAPICSTFFAALQNRKIGIVNKILYFIAVAGTLSITLFSTTFMEDCLRPILAIAVSGFVYTMAVDEIYYFFSSTYRNWKTAGASQPLGKEYLKAFLETPHGNIMIAGFILIFTVVFDSYDSFVLHTGILLSRYGFLFFTCVMIFIIARKYAVIAHDLEAKTEKQSRIIERSNKGMNRKLVEWIVVNDRDPLDLPVTHIDQTIMFTDIRNFSTISERMSTSDVITFLCAVFRTLEKPIAIAAANPDLVYTDKFIGDNMMNIFTNKILAVRVAIDFRHELKRFNRNPRAYFSAAPSDLVVDVGTGIASGLVSSGIMGHSSRIDYTVIGDTVNLASRLEGLTKEYHLPILTGGITASSLDKGRFCKRFIDRIRVRGRHTVVDLYEIYNTNDALIRDLKRSLESEFCALRDAYFAGEPSRDIIAAAEVITAAYEKEGVHSVGGDCGMDPLPLIYAQRALTLDKHPALRERWTGVYDFAVNSHH